MTTLNISLMLSMLAIAGLFAGGLFTVAPYAAFAEEEGTSIENEAEASNEDNDEVKQENEAEIEQESETECDSAAAVLDNDVVGVTGANVAVSGDNDCDTSQTAAVVQGNSNTDNDVQVASADACQAVLAVLGFSVC